MIKIKMKKKKDKKKKNHLRNIDYKTFKILRKLFNLLTMLTLYQKTKI